MLMMINGISDSLANALAGFVGFSIMGAGFYWLFAIAMRTPPEIAADEKRKLGRKASKMA